MKIGTIMSKVMSQRLHDHAIKVAKAKDAHACMHVHGRHSGEADSSELLWYA